LQRLELIRRQNLFQLRLRVLLQLVNLLLLVVAEIKLVFNEPGEQVKPARSVAWTSIGPAAATRLPGRRRVARRVLSMNHGGNHRAREEAQRQQTNRYMTLTKHGRLLL
jgi:hypothetical protein